ncbi:phosphatidylserine decarboxylase-related [Desulfatibacillum aliphaticivorans]|uniref:Phosphatidylserine decarboxylase-related n=1 Tax=Desulfatibacillum aliphaticivorans TaxID=218208 RepID=B8FHE3_DESAL|nr:phosphatidylserine decarboxylase [Desulfatibacillum aliphaticivorans]ACL02231.1 phosphatidylserine decarboxylase-related [Desulfatibacillum aliphaticivorans]
MNLMKKAWSGSFPHQYIQRKTGGIVDEALVGDLAVLGLYSTAREKAAWLFNALTSARASRVLGFCNYDLPILNPGRNVRVLAEKMGADLEECVDPPEYFTNARRFFERKIKYWQTRPMPEDPRAIVSPADARVIVGALEEHSHLYLKESLFGFEDLLGLDKPEWLKAFQGGDFAVFRLTPDKYHYNHSPVAGQVVDIYEIHGAYHSCNPGAVIMEATPYSKNKRAVTIIDTDVPGGTQISLVAMIEVAAMMIGDIVQCYSSGEYDSPQEVEQGLFLERGQPKSLYRPGSSTDVILFQKGRMQFCGDLLQNTLRTDVQSRFSQGFGRAMVETEVLVREQIGCALS